MSFVDRDFAWFLPLALALWFATRSRPSLRTGLMLALSLFFYGKGHWWVLLIMGAYCLVDWQTGLLLQRSARRRVVLACGVGFNLAVLCFWKYTPLIVNTVFGAWQVQAAALDGWVIPMGISFYCSPGSPT